MRRERREKEKGEVETHLNLVLPSEDELLAVVNVDERRLARLDGLGVTLDDKVGAALVSERLTNRELLKLVLARLGGHEVGKVTGRRLDGKEGEEGLARVSDAHRALLEALRSVVVPVRCRGAEDDLLSALLDAVGSLASPASDALLPAVLSNNDGVLLEGVGEGRVTVRENLAGREVDVDVEVGVGDGEAGGLLEVVSVKHAVVAGEVAVDELELGVGVEGGDELGGELPSDATKAVRVIVALGAAHRESVPTTVEVPAGEGGTRIEAVCVTGGGNEGTEVDGLADGRCAIEGATRGGEGGTGFRDDESGSE